MGTAERIRERVGPPEAYARGRGVRWAAVIGAGVLAAAVFPFDGAVSDAARAFGSRLGGDVVRELEAVQQFGGVVSVALVAWLVWVIDPRGRRRLLDLVASVVVTAVVVQALKMVIGRPRPKFEDPGHVLGPFGAYPIADAAPPGVYHAWEVWTDISSDLWSMPSSHTSGAVALATFCAVVYPRVRAVVVTLACVVGVARVVLGAHYVSDVLVGAGMGFACAHAATTGYWGVRGLDWVWVRAVDRRATPAYPAMVGRGAGDGADAGDRRAGSSGDGGGEGG